MDVKPRTARNRRLLTDFGDSLDDHQLATHCLRADLAGRAVALDDLTGAGVDELRRRLGRGR